MTVTISGSFFLLINTSPTNLFIEDYKSVHLFLLSLYLIAVFIRPGHSEVEQTGYRNHRGGGAWL